MATQVSLTTHESGCGTPPPFASARLGPLGAGTYQVTWFFEPDQTPAATATLIVAAAVAAAPAPALSYWTMLLFALLIGALAARHLRDGNSES